MLDAVPRKDKHVAQLIEHFNQRLSDAKNDIPAMRASLTASEQQIIADELQRVSTPDPAAVRYFLENYFVINTKGGNEDDDMAVQELRTMYPFMEPQEVLWNDKEGVVYSWERKLPLWWIMLKARQIGWSTIVQGMLFHRVIFNKNMNVLVIADELTRTQNIFDKSLLAYNNLPFWMRPEKQYDNRGKGILRFDRMDPDERMVNPGLNSQFFTDAANKPSGSSRGFTLHGFHASEFGLFLRPKILTQDIIPATAKRNPLTIAVVEGTADEGHNKTYKKMWEMAVHGKSHFRPMFAAWWKERTYCKPFPSDMEEDAFVFSPDEKELCSKVRDEYDYEITKEQMNWYRQEADQFEATESDREMMEQEYPSYPKSAFRTGGICAFPRKKLTQIEKRDVRTPIWWGELVFRMDGDQEKPVFIKYGPAKRDAAGQIIGDQQELSPYAAPLWIWEWPVSTDIYYEASDPSQGIPDPHERTDFAAAQIFRVPRKAGERIRQCLEFKGYVDPRTLSKIVCTLGKFYNTCEMAPECNTLTEHIGNILHIHKYPNIYRWRRQDKISGHWTNFFGWETQSKSREDLMARFKALLIEDSLEIRSQRLLDEAQSFIDDGTGRFEASGDQHDDVLFAAMICVYCLMELDPRLFKLVDTEPLDTTNRDFHNTDYSLSDKEAQDMDTDFACL